MGVKLYIYYLLLLDASKAFDKVSYEKLFELLLARNVTKKKKL